MFDLHSSYSSLSVETSYVHVRSCFLALFIFITQCGKLVCTYMFPGIVQIQHSVWKTCMYISVSGYCSYSSLSVENSYVHKCFRVLFIFITKFGKLVCTYMFPGIVHIYHCYSTFRHNFRV